MNWKKFFFPTIPKIIFPTFCIIFYFFYISINHGFWEDLFDLLVILFYNQRVSTLLFSIPIFLKLLIFCLKWYIISCYIFYSNNHLLFHKYSKIFVLLVIFGINLFVGYNSVLFERLARYPNYLRVWTNGLCKTHLECPPDYFCYNSVECKNDVCEQTGTLRCHKYCVIGAKNEICGENEICKDVIIWRYYEGIHLSLCLPK